MKKQSGKTLVEILAVELNEWPDCAFLVMQDINCDVICESCTGHNWAIFVATELSCDWDTQSVTRVQWEAERAKLIKPKASAREWVRNRGRKNPLDVCTLVDARLRSGEVVVGKFSDNLHWVHAGNNFDVMAYRVNESVDSETPEVTAPNDRPLQWRDRITEIDRSVEALEEERASLIQKLADEGFKLINREAVALPDMSDWCNWKIGDLLEVVKEEFGHKFQIGEIVRMKSLPTVTGGQIKCEHIDSSGWWWLNNQELKFHSRPTK